MKELSPQYNFQDVEERVYRQWETSGFFNPDKLPGKRKKTFCITVPPPNITGALHMGHALNATIQDILIRKKRMEGYKTLWLPGTDHAGIAMQNVVEKQLRKENLSRHTLGREEFLKRAWQWKEQYGNIILDQFKKLGSSMDWSRTRFTLDTEYQNAVKFAFTYYYKKGWIYRAERVVNWCSRCGTNLSDLELEYQEVQSLLYVIKYPLAGEKNVFIRVATTRPETMLGDSAVAVHPRDTRYRHLVGKNVLLPIQNREIPIVADRRIDMNFGTGAVKITPAHDMLDAEIGRDHNLPSYTVIGSDAKMTSAAGALCENCTTVMCRDRVVAELTRLGLLEKSENYRHNIAVCYRCATVIEPIPSLQWFVKMAELGKKAAHAVRSGRIRFHPKRWERTYLAWIKNVRDWTISRQIWWGHTIPLKGETDVLDTWFSSALWPFATLGWPKKTRDIKIFYPTQVLSTARDIINLWVSRMIFSGLTFMKKEPFRDVIIHATILTRDGRRMSKSLGTGIDPMELIGRYGADATRFGLIWQTMGSQDIHWSEEHVVAGRKFANKIWNAARYVLTQLPSIHPRLVIKKPKPLTVKDKKILVALDRATREVSRRIERYEFGPALHIFYDFFWHTFCDDYIEVSKLQMKDKKLQKNTQAILRFVLEDSLKLLHPFMPYVTEEIWKHITTKQKIPLIIASWPR